MCERPRSQQVIVTGSVQVDRVAKASRFEGHARGRSRSSSTTGVAWLSEIKSSQDVRLTSLPSAKFSLLPNPPTSQLQSSKMPQSLLDTQSCGHTAILQKDVRQYGATYHKVSQQKRSDAQSTDHHASAAARRARRSSQPLQRPRRDQQEQEPTQEQTERRSAAQIDIKRSRSGCKCAHRSFTVCAWCSHRTGVRSSVRNTSN